MSEETAQSLILELAKAQQLVEISEACDVVSATGDASNDAPCSMMSKWSRRLSGCKSSLLLGEQIIAFRLSLIHQLMHLKRMSTLQALPFMEQTLEVLHNGL